MINRAVKYRPETFDSVFGNEVTISELKERSKGNRFSQVIYFNGLTGSGKTTLQFIVAKAILCKNKDGEGNPCNSCPTCNAINNQNETLYFYYYNASNVDTDTARAIENLARSGSLSSVNEKVIIIDEMQELHQNPKARKNLLTLFERKNINTYFILGAMDDSKVDDAIKGRAIKYYLENNIIDKAVVIKYLETICNDEKVIMDANKTKVLEALAEFSSSDFRKAVSLLERVLESKKGELWNLEKLKKELHVYTDADIIEIMNKIINRSKSVFDITFDKDLIDTLTWRFQIYYKGISGYDIPKWQKDKLKGIQDVDSRAYISSLIKNLFELNKYIYVTPTLIEFYLLDTMNKYSTKMKDDNIESKGDDKIELKRKKSNA